jgi:hypothetical protein
MTAVLFTALLGAVPASAGYQWQPVPGTTTELALLKDGKQVGGWNVLEGYYRPRDPVTGKWGARARPPVEPPAANFGLDARKLAGKTRYLVDGKEVPRDEVFPLLAGDSPVPDDAGKLRVVVIGEGRDKVVADFNTHPSLAAWKEKAVVQGYDPKHWHVRGFVTTGKPTVYCLLPDGGVLHRQDDYAGGAEALAQALAEAERLRRPSPDYEPKKDPDRRTPPPILPKLPQLPRVPWSVALLAGAVGLAFLLTRRKS